MKSWVALVVRPRAERNAQRGLVNAGIETFVAWHGVRRRWSDRIKTIEENLLPGYVFCRSGFEERMLVMRQPGVQSVVRFDDKPAQIPDEEIEALRRVIGSGLPLGPWPFLTSGQCVRIERGVLSGLEGRLVGDSSSWHVVVSVNAVHRSVAVEVERDMIRPLVTADRSRSWR